MRFRRFKFNQSGGGYRNEVFLRKLGSIKSRICTHGSHLEITIVGVTILGFLRSIVVENIINFGGGKLLKKGTKNNEI